MFLLGLGHGECGSVRPGRYWARSGFEMVDRRSDLLIKQGCALVSAESSFEGGLCTPMADGMVVCWREGERVAFPVPTMCPPNE